MSRSEKKLIKGGIRKQLIRKDMKESTVNGHEGKHQKKKYRVKDSKQHRRKNVKKTKEKTNEKSSKWIKIENIEKC